MSWMYFYIGAEYVWDRPTNCWLMRPLQIGESPETRSSFFIASVSKVREEQAVEVEARPIEKNA
jgi:hypothetical protein